jgi:osmotically-inducible protein OsmY
MKLIQVLRIIAILSMLTLQGCAALAVTGAATGASVAYDRRTTGTVVEDEAIELKAAKAIFEDKALQDQAHLNVTSYNTRVLVTGETPTEELRARAIDIVRHIDKVTQVFNEITVAAPSSLMTRSSDSVITSKVKTKLLANEQISGINVKVVTENGVVYLMGIVARSESDLATDIARQTGGVQKVVKLFEYSD